ncbi:MAG: hypothetical protein NUV73_01480, partial [Candidatus Daviesbacteria bacterium]|nr:hypothetical protein [Candidatus Daviesbacteria bacterium]
VGSVLLPQFEGSGGRINLKLKAEKYEIKQGNFRLIPCPKERCEIEYSLQSGKFLGKQASAVEVYGGKLGLMVDGRSL